MLKISPADVYDALSSDGRAVTRMSNMLRYIGYPPVSDLVVVLVALTPIPRSSNLYSVAAKYRWKFFSDLSQWVFMRQLAIIVTDPEAHCECSEHISPEQHSTAAAQTLQELVEKLCIEDAGEILLQPLGYTEDLLDNLMISATAVSDLDCFDSVAAAGVEVSDPRVRFRRSALKIIIFLVKRSANAENMFFVCAPGGQPTPTLVPNRLHTLRGRMIVQICTKIMDLDHALLRYMTRVAGAGARAVEGGSSSGGGGVSIEPIKYPGHQVELPFTSHRVQLVELLVLLVEAGEDREVLDCISPDLWRTLIAWVFQFAHNNMFHSLFFRLMFAVLRSVLVLVCEYIYMFVCVCTVSYSSTAYRASALICFDLF